MESPSPYIPPPDPQTFDIVKATQFGVYDRCLYLITSGYDVNQRDSENVTLLHWAAINCRIELLKLYISHGAVVDAFGGELNSTPLHWASRQGHLSAVILLMKHGADPLLRDGQGWTAIHLAARFGYTSIVAYLLAQGISPDLPDGTGMTPLMLAVRWNHGQDPTGLLLAFGANPFLQDRLEGNTALHWAIEAKNVNGVKLLCEKNASFDIPNRKDETPYEILQKLIRESESKNDWICRGNVETIIAKKERRRRFWLNEQFRVWMKAALPFILIYVLGTFFSAEMNYVWKAFFLFGIYLGYRFGRDFIMSIPLIHGNVATMLWMYIVWYWYIMETMSSNEWIIFLVLAFLQWSNFIRAWIGDPGIISPLEVEERDQTMIELAEEDLLNSIYFCTKCLIRRPPRSKHCYVCDKCIARWDHHCYWLNNCVGWRNHKYFVGYLISMAMMSVFAFYLAGKYLLTKCDFVQVLTCEPWILFMALQDVAYGAWMTVILYGQLYQVLWLGLTTYERFGSSARSPTGARPYSNRGVVRNFIDFFELRVFGPDRTDWSRTWVHPRDQVNASLKW